MKKKKISKSLPIGQTLETDDIYLPYGKGKKPNSKKRPVIIADKQRNYYGEEEYIVIPASKQKTNNTFPYYKYGIKNIRIDIEVEDNEGKPIKQNEKFKLTNNCSQLPFNEAKDIRDKVLNHSKFSSENRRKYNKFWQRYKKSRD